MPDNETQQNPTESGALCLSPAQLTAWEALLAGKTITHAAAEAGVDRCTVHTWLRNDFCFQAAVNRGRRELQEAARQRLEALADKALACIEQAVDQDGDTKTALEIIKGMGLLAGCFRDIGSEHPEVLLENAETEAELYGYELFEPQEGP